jgi:hypothetical protein
MGAVAVWQLKWKEHLPWCRYNQEMTLAFCDICCRHVKGDTVWWTGKKQSHMEKNLKDHADSKTHKAAAVEEAQLDVAMGGNNGIASFMESATSLVCEQTENKMRCCYLLCKENIALLKMQKICAVVEQCKAPMGNAYREDCAAREMALILAEEITEPVIEAIKCSPAFSIIIDESKDTGDKSNMALRIKYFQNDVGDNANVLPHRVCMAFVQCLHCSGGGSAGALVKVVLDFLTGRGVDAEKMVVLATDGASVMTGADSGVTTRLKKLKNPHMISMHCVAHKLALVANAAMDSSPELTAFETDISTICSFFSKSTKRQSGLKACFEACDNEVCYKMTHPSGTRWLSRAIALKAIFHNHANLIKYLKTTHPNEEGADYILQKLSSFSFLMQLTAMTDILGSLNLVSMAFQSDSLTHRAVTVIVDQVKASFRECYISVSHGSQTPCFQIKLRKLLSAVDLQMTERGVDTDEEIQEIVIEGNEISYSAGQRGSVETVRTEFVTRIESQLILMFPKDSTSVFSALDVLSPSNAALC